MVALRVGAGTNYMPRHARTRLPGDPHGCLAYVEEQPAPTLIKGVKPQVPAKLMLALLSMRYCITCPQPHPAACQPSARLADLHPRPLLSLLPSPPSTPPPAKNKETNERSIYGDGSSRSTLCRHLPVAAVYRVVYAIVAILVAAVDAELAHSVPPLHMVFAALEIPICARSRDARISMQKKKPGSACRAWATSLSTNYD